MRFMKIGIQRMIRIQFQTPLISNAIFEIINYEMMWSQIVPFSFINSFQRTWFYSYEFCEVSIL